MHLINKQNMTQEYPEFQWTIKKLKKPLKNTCYKHKWLIWKLFVGNYPTELGFAMLTKTHFTDLILLQMQKYFDN